MITLAVLLFALFTKNTVYLLSWLLIIVMVILVLSIKKHSLFKTLLSLLTHILIAYGAVRGFFMSPHSPAEYPTDAEIIQVCFHRGGLDDSAI